MIKIEYNNGEERLNGPSTMHTTHGGLRRWLQQQNPKIINQYQK